MLRSLAAGQLDADRHPTKGWLRVTRTEAERAREEQKRWINLIQAAEQIGCTVAHARTAVRAGKITSRLSRGSRPCVDQESVTHYARETYPGLLRHEQESRDAAIRVADLPRVLVRRHLPFGVLLDARYVLDAQLLGQVLDHGPRDRQRLLQEQPDVPHRTHLEREPETVVITTALRDQLPIDVVEVEEPLQLGPRRILAELPVRLGLLVSQEFHRHPLDRSLPPQATADLFAEPLRPTAESVLIGQAQILSANDCSVVPRDRIPVPS